MKELAKELDELLSRFGKDAPDLMAAFTKLGHGNPHEGVRQFASYCTKHGMRTNYVTNWFNGWLNGALMSLGGVAIGAMCHHLFMAHKAKKDVLKNGTEVLSALMNSVSKKRL